jgi:GNAT superfamily N-acetyltransferase
MTERAPIAVRAAEQADAEWIRSFLTAHWHATIVVARGEIIDAAVLPALIAGDHQGLATYRCLGADAELVTLNAVPAWSGIGSALIEALVDRVQAKGCARLWLTTTNDNLPALRFYMRRGFRLIEVRPGAVDEARKLKPISALGQHGIAIHDEIELCRMLGPDGQFSGAVRPPWGSSQRRTG